MIDTLSIRAFLDERHHGHERALSAFAEETLGAAPDPGDDDVARLRARELCTTLGEGGWLEVIRDQDLRACAISREVLSYVSPLADEVFALQALSTIPFLIGADDALRERWVPGLIDGSCMGAFAMTEAEAGSDVSAIQTRARRDEDTYVIDGTKSFISNAGVADIYVVFATLDPKRRGKGITAFAVPSDTPGFSFTGAQVLSAPHPLGELALDGCRIPASHRIGEEGKGLRIGLGTLDRLRATVGAAACGMAARALDEATRHALTRRMLDAPLADLQLIQEKIARMATDLTASRLLVYHALWEKDGGAERVGLQSSKAKAFATEAAQRIIDDAVQVLGGRGVLVSHPVDHLYRAVRALRIYEGSTEIQQLIIARHVLADAKERLT